MSCRISIFIRSPITNFNFRFHAYILVDLLVEQGVNPEKNLPTKQKLGASNADTQFLVNTMRVRELLP
jgi:hypothetical protein